MAPALLSEGRHTRGLPERLADQGWKTRIVPRVFYSASERLLLLFRTPYMLSPIATATPIPATAYAMSVSGIPGADEGCCFS
jgi:hypothetical protein